MQIFEPNSQLMKIMKGIERLLHLQLLWLIYTLRGAIVIGLFPSTAALYAAIRKLLRDGGDIEINDYFKVKYKESMKDSNILGYLLLVMSVLLIVNLRSAQLMQSTIGFVYVFISYGLMILLIIFSLTIWAFLAHFALSLGQVIKHAIVILLLNPLHSFAVFIVFALFLWSSIRFGILLPFILISVLVYAVSLIIKDAITRTEALQKRKLSASNKKPRRM